VDPTRIHETAASGPPALRRARAGVDRRSTAVSDNNKSRSARIYETAANCGPPALRRARAGVDRRSTAVSDKKSTVVSDKKSTVVSDKDSSP